MPFKSGKSVNDVNTKLKRHFEQVVPRRIKVGLMNLGSELGLLSDQYTPIELGKLRNSRNQTVDQTGSVFTLTLGYYRRYAGALHSPQPGSRIDGWQPRPVPSPGKRRGGYNPDAQQGWLNRAWAENEARLLDDLAEDITK